MATVLFVDILLRNSWKGALILCAMSTFYAISLVFASEYLRKCAMPAGVSWPRLQVEMLWVGRSRFGLGRQVLGVLVYRRAWGGAEMTELGG